MSFKSTLRLFAITLIVFAGAASRADEVTEPADAQRQPAQTLPPNPLPGTRVPSAPERNPVPDSGTTGQSACIDETGDYEAHRAAVFFVIGLQNKCEKRLRCRIYAYVVGAKGPSSAETTMILGAESSGAAAKRSYAMRVKAAGGTAQVSRECRVF